MTTQRYLSILDTIQEAAAKVIDSGKETAREVFMAHAEAAQIEDGMWTLMLAHLLALEANFPAGAEPLPATAGANPDEAC